MAVVRGLIARQRMSVGAPEPLGMEGFQQHSVALLVEQILDGKEHHANNRSTSPTASSTASVTAAASSVGSLHPDGPMSRGSNLGGQIGDGTTAMDRRSPTVVTGLTDVVQIAGGQSHTCARIINGTVRCWGRNDLRQVGDGTNVFERLTATAVTGLTGVVEIAAGSHHNCARLTSGAVRCWGNNEFGQIGDGTLVRSRNEPTAVDGLTNAVGLAAGENHTCAVLTDGSVRCWGLNESGQLGDGTLTLRPLPTPVRF